MKKNPHSNTASMGINKTFLLECTLIILLTMITSNEQTEENQQSEVDSRYPCGACDITVTWDQRGVECESCGQWFHAECQHIDSNSYNLLGRSDLTWHCVICANANDSIIAFDLHGIGSMSQQNQNISCETSDYLHNISTPTSQTKVLKPIHTSTPTRASKQDKHIRRPLRFLNINCYHLTAKVAELDNLIQTTRPDIVFGTESWLTPSISNTEVFPNGFTVYRRDRPQGEWDKESGGGIFILVANSLTSHEVPELHMGYENIWVKVKIQGRRTLLLSCFYHPHTGYTESMQAFVKSASTASLHYPNAIIVAGGDFNLPGWNWTTKTLKKRMSTS